MIRKGVVTRKEGNHYFIRYYGESISNSSGFDAELGESLIVKGAENLEVGDFIETEYHQRDNVFSSYGFICEKFKPTNEDIHKNEMLQKYLDEVAEQGGMFFRDILSDSQSEFRKASTPNPMHILLSDEEILSLVQKYKDSIKTFGIEGSSGSAAFIIQTQLGTNNLFDKPRKRYQDIIGVDTAPFMKRQLPSCVSNYYMEMCAGIAEIGNPGKKFIGNGSTYCINYSGDTLFQVSITESAVNSIPYKKGKVIEVRETQKRKNVPSHNSDEDKHK